MRKRSHLIIVTLKFIILLSILVSCAGTFNIRENVDSTIDNIQNEEPQIEKKELIFKVEKGFELKISEMEDIAFGFVHTGSFSPEGDVTIITEEIDHGLQTLSIRTNFQTHIVEKMIVSPKSYSWSSSGKYVVIHNVDYYADEGSTGIVVLNVQSGHYIEITRDQLINEKDLGKRDKLNVYNIVWLDSDRFSVIVSAGFLGESGHPGINYNRKVNLGVNFGNKDNIILVANWEVRIVNDISKSLNS